VRVGFEPTRVDRFAPSSGGLIPPIARDTIQGLLGYVVCARCPLYHLGEFPPPHPPALVGLMHSTQTAMPR